MSTDLAGKAYKGLNLHINIIIMCNWNFNIQYGILIYMYTCTLSLFLQVLWQFWTVNTACRYHNYIDNRLQPIDDHYPSIPSNNFVLLQRPVFALVWPQTLPRSANPQYSAASSISWESTCIHCTMYMYTAEYACNTCTCTCTHVHVHACNHNSKPIVQC